MSRKVTKPRIVPTSERKRAVRSCDRCKNRKTKCVRTKPGSNGSSVTVFDAAVACASCAKAGTPCVTTGPRDSSSWGQLQQQQQQQQQQQHQRTQLPDVHERKLATALAVLAKNVCPGIDTSSVESVIEYGAKLGIKMPSTADLEAGLHLSGMQNLVVKTGTSTTQTALVSATAESAAAEPQKLQDYGVERVVYDVEGKPHYVGYASTLALFRSLSSLASKNGNKDVLVQTYNGVAKQRQRPEQHRKPANAVAFVQDPILAMLSDFLPLWTLFPFGNVELSKPAADECVDAFFHEIHYDFLVLNEKTFRENYAQFWVEVSELRKVLAESSSSGTEDVLEKVLHVRSLSSHWTICIFMVIVLACHHCPSSYEPVAEKLLESVQMCLHKIVSRPSLSGIRVLYFLAIHHHANRNSNPAWILLGLALRQAVSMGLHRESRSLDVKFKAPVSIRKQIWWSLHMLDIMMSSRFGRPCAVSQDDINVEYPADVYCSPGNEDFCEFYVAKIELTKYLYEIVRLRQTIYDTHGETPVSLSVVTETLNIKRKLSELWQNLQSRNMTVEYALQSCVLNDAGVPVYKRYRFELEMCYHNYVVTMCLPFSLYLVNILMKSPENLAHLDSPLLSIINGGIESSIQIGELLCVFLKAHVLEGVLSNDIFFAYVSLMMLVLSFLTLKRTESLERNGVNITNVQHLRNSLKANSETPLTIDLVLQTIFKTRSVLLSKKIKLGGTLQRTVDITEGLLRDTGIVAILEKMSVNMELSDSFDHSKWQFNNVWEDAGVEFLLNSDAIDSFLQTSQTRSVLPFELWKAGTASLNGNGEYAFDFSDSEWHELFEQFEF